MISKLFNIKDEYQLKQLNRLFAKNCIWLLPVLSIISIIDIIISVVLHHMPYASMITLLINIIFIAIAFIKVRTIKNA